MKKKIIFIFGSLIFLFSCASTQVDSPALVLKIQELEEKIINEHLQKKLDPIEGIWQANYGKVQRIEAFYKRGDIFIWVILRNDGGGQVKKISEYNYSGNCKIPDLFAPVEADMTVLSTDDNTLNIKCVRKNYVSQSETTSKALADILIPAPCEVYYLGPCLARKKKTSKPVARDYVVTGIFKRLWPENLSEHNSKF